MYYVSYQDCVMILLIVDYICIVGYFRVTFRGIC
jgi:hypothetical protein